MHAVTVSPCCISRRPCSLHTSKMRADVCYDLNYADVVLQASDGVEFPTSRGLCGGSCSTLKTLFEVKSDQKVYLISEVSSHTLFPLLKWLHGPRSGLNLELTHEQALPMLRAADYLGMQCWIDNCACHMKLESDWLTWVELANEFSSTDLLLAVLQHIPARLQLSGPDICCKLHSIKLMQVALQFFDQGFLTVVERFYLVIKEWGHIPNDLAEYCIEWPICQEEYPCLADMVERHKIVLEPVWFAQLLRQANSYTNVQTFPVGISVCNEAVTVSTGFGRIQAIIDESFEVLTLTKLDGRPASGYVRVRCLPYLSELEPDGTGLDLPVKCVTELCYQPLTWVLPYSCVPVVVFCDAFGKDKEMQRRT